MDVRNCVRCGRIFNYITGQPICVECKAELEKKFSEVKFYLRENPGANIQEVSEANNVEIRQIKQWIREERITFSEGSMVGIECEMCGTMIRTGRFCNKCKADLADGLKSIGESAQHDGFTTAGAVRPLKREEEENRLRFRK